VEEFVVKVIDIERITHDVKRFRVEKPPGYSFTPGQATDLSITVPEFRKKKRPFSFTCLSSDPYLEFTIKIYSGRNGVTNQLNMLGKGSELIIRDAWGAISYRGKGVFIAGGAGITPFMAIIRDLAAKNEVEGNTLIFANKTSDDIIYGSELNQLLGNSFINILSEERKPGYFNGFINSDFLNQTIVDFNTNFYVCGPPPMMDIIIRHLSGLGVAEKSIILEL
jgi:ferredoxin-NADP reductase